MGDKSFSLFILGYRNKIIIRQGLSPDLANHSFSADRVHQQEHCRARSLEGQVLLPVVDMIEEPNRCIACSSSSLD